MKTHFDIEKFIEQGSINNDLDFERAMIVDRKLRLLSKNSVHFKNLRKQLRDLIEVYETKNWTNLESLTPERIIDSDKCEFIVEQERIVLNMVEEYLNRI